MKIRLPRVVNKCWTNVKKNKKIVWIILIILTALITIVIDNTIGIPLSDFVHDLWSKIIGPKPVILLNVAIIKNLNKDAVITKSGLDTKMYDITNQINFNKSYGPLFALTKWGLGTLYLADKSAVMESKKDYPTLITSAALNFTSCPNCVHYILTLKNFGDKTANEIVIDIKTSGNLKMTMDDPKISKKYCGGYFESRGCRLVIEDIAIKDQVNFALEAENESDINITCNVDLKDYCKVRLIEIYACDILPVDKINSLKFDGTEVALPTLKNYQPDTLYYWDTNQTKWINTPGRVEYEY